jgi:hypothetical protein
MITLRVELYVRKHFGTGQVDNLSLGTPVSVSARTLNWRNRDFAQNRLRPGQMTEMGIFRQLLKRFLVIDLRIITAQSRLDKFDE